MSKFTSQCRTTAIGCIFTIIMAFNAHTSSAQHHGGGHGGPSQHGGYHHGGGYGGHYGGFGYGGFGYGGPGFGGPGFGGPGFGGPGFGGLGFGGLGFGGLGYGGLGYSGLGLSFNTYDLGYGGLGYSASRFAYPSYGGYYGSGYGYNLLLPATPYDLYGVPGYGYAAPPVAKYSAPDDPGAAPYAAASPIKVDPSDPALELRPGMVLPDGSRVISVDPVK